MGRGVRVFKFATSFCYNVWGTTRWHKMRRPYENVFHLSYKEKEVQFGDRWHKELVKNPKIIWECVSALKKCHPMVFTKFEAQFNDKWHKPCQGTRNTQTPKWYMKMCGRSKKMPLLLGATKCEAQLGDLSPFPIHDIRLDLSFSRPQRWPTRPITRWQW